MTVFKFRLANSFFAVVLSLAMAHAGAESTMYDCVVQAKKHYLANQRELLDGPNDELPGKPASHFTIDRKTGEIQGFSSSLGDFSMPAMTGGNNRDGFYFVYYANRKDGSVSVLHVNIYESSHAQPQLMKALLGRLVFNGECR